MARLASKFAATIGALFGLTTATAVTNNEIAFDLFWMVHELVPDLEKIKSELLARGFQVSIQSDGENTSVLEAKSADGLTDIVIDKNDFKPLGLMVSYTLTRSETDQKFAAVLGKDLTMKLNWVEPGPLPEEYVSENWDSMAWPGEEGSDQTIYAVGYSQKYKATNIWGSQIHSEGE